MWHDFSIIVNISVYYVPPNFNTEIINHVMAKASKGYIAIKGV